MSFLLRYGGRVLKLCTFRSLAVDRHFICIKNRIWSSTFIERRYYGDIQESFVPFDTLVSNRRCQAKRSAIIQVNSDLSFPELHSYCSQFGTILGVHHYTVFNGQQNFMLVEFSSEAESSKLISHGCFVTELDLIPVKSSFLWFRPSKGMGNHIWNVLKSNRPSDNAQLVVRDGCEISSEAAVLKSIIEADDVSQQIQTLYDMTCLNDLGTRLRYMVARQVESALIGLYPDATVRPFGSTVNGFGKMGCDLDLLLRFTADNELECEPEGRLVFHTKKSTMSGRGQQQRFMEVISDIVQLFIPGCSHVRRILQARIPIIKYNQDYAGLECDLSMASMTGVYMSELLYMYGCFDERVRPLVFAVRKWAQNVGITNPSPGRWITNFPLTLMVLYFLQNTDGGAILPSFNQLKKNAGKSDKRLTDDLVNCTFQRDIRPLLFKNESSKNVSSLETLLHQFFEFYASFEFSINAISINEGKPVRKPDFAPLYIVNPLEVNLNVSKNVSIEECERLRIELRNASWQMESCSEKLLDDVWGVAVALRMANKTSIKQQTNQHNMPSNRLVAIKDLFNEGGDSSYSIDKDLVFNSLHGEILEMAKGNQTEKVQFKNSEVKKHVIKIQREISDTNKRLKKIIDKGTETKDLVTFRRKTRRR